MTNEVLLYTADSDAARAEIEAVGGQVLVQFTDVVFSAALPDAFDVRSLKSSSSDAPDHLDEVSEMSAVAWSADADQERAPEPYLSWDTLGKHSPKDVWSDAELAREQALESLAPTRHDDIQRSTDTPTSRYLVGRVAVGVIIVSGSRRDLEFSDDERKKIIQEVQYGLSYLAQAEPRAKVTFELDTRFLTVSAPECATLKDYEHCESPWRNAALEQLGFAGSRQGSQDYVRDLIEKRGTQWGFVAYFTKYRLYHFAYAVHEKICMHYYNDNWGPDKINQVFAHEACHIFGAADEYGKCKCNSKHGHLKIGNNNCVNCAGNREECLMDGNKLTLCKWSRGQLGWDDSLFPPSGAPTAGVHRASVLSHS